MPTKPRKPLSPVARQSLMAVAASAMGLFFLWALGEWWYQTGNGSFWIALLGAICVPLTILLVWRLTEPKE